MGTPLDNAKALYLTAISDGDYEAAITRHSGDRYTQHSTPVRDGRAGEPLSGVPIVRPIIAGVLSVQRDAELPALL